MQSSVDKLILSGLRSIIFVLWKLKLDFLISKFLAFVIILYNKDEINKKKNKTAILAMQRVAFNDDVMALRESPSKYRMLFYPYLLRVLVCDKPNMIFPEEIQQQTSFYPKKDKYKPLFDRLSILFYNALNFVEYFIQSNIKIILTANIDYYQDYPWISTIHKKGGKFITLEKESIFYMLDAFEDLIISWHKQHGFRYEGDAVLFFNELAKKTYVKTGGVDSKLAFVTGSPRVDRLVSLSKNNVKNSDFILAASFITSFTSPKEEAIKVWDEIVNAIYQDEPIRDKTIIKCKNASEVKEIKSRYPDIIAVSDSNEKYLQKKPLIFIGFNTTACLDAIIVGIPIVIPWWGDAKKAGKDALFGEHTSSYHLIARNKEELINVLGDYIGGHAQKYSNIPTVWKNSNFKKLVEERYSPIDGKNCQRFFDFIDKILDNKNN